MRSNPFRVDASRCPPFPGFAPRADLCDPSGVGRGRVRKGSARVCPRRDTWILTRDVKRNHPGNHPAGVEQVSPGCEPRETGAGKNPNPERVQPTCDAKRNHPGNHRERRASPDCCPARNTNMPQSTPQNRQLFNPFRVDASGCPPFPGFAPRADLCDPFGVGRGLTGDVKRNHPGPTPNAAHPPDCRPARNAITPQSTPQNRQLQPFQG